MGEPASKEKSILEQWMELTEDVVGEIVAGDLYVSPRPSPKHIRTASVLGVKIGGPFDIGGPGGWWILDEPEIHLDSHILVPDLAGWKRERMPQIPNEAFFTLIPDWVCEVLSPSTRRLDKSKKMPLYAQQGLKYLWLVDPVDKTLEVYENQGSKWFLHHVYSDKDIAQAAPVDSLKIDLSELWS